MILRRNLARVATAARRWIVAAPGTHIYLLVLLVTTQTVRSLHPALASQLLRQASTNLTEMGRSSGRVLFLSAFLLDGGHWIAQAIAFSAVYVPLERRAGSLRWLAVVIAGHVGATVVTTVGIWADVRSNRGAAPLTHAIDVGVSYGLISAAAYLALSLRTRVLRRSAFGALATALCYTMIRSHTFTDAGHLAAMVIGAAMFMVFAPPARPSPSVLLGMAPTVGLEGSKRYPRPVR